MLRTASLELQDVVRRAPEAFLARSIIVCEGKTEVGILRTLKTRWQAAHDDTPIEHHGVAVVDGGGSCAPRVATELAKLGYRTLLFRDSDRPLPVDEENAAAEANVSVLEWDGASSTEERILADVSPKTVQRILDLAYDVRGCESVLDTITTRLGFKRRLPPSFSDWSSSGKPVGELRAAIAASAKNSGWFKNVDLGEQLGEIVADAIAAGLDAPTVGLLSGIEAWAYGVR